MMGKPQEGITPDNITCKCNTSSVVPICGLQQGVHVTKPPPTSSGDPWHQSDPRVFVFARPLPLSQGEVRWALTSAGSHLPEPR